MAYVGYRCFTVCDRDELHPVGKVGAAAWGPGPNVASCYCPTADGLYADLGVDDRIVAGAAPHKCGFWAYHDLDEALAMSSSDRWAGSARWVLAAVVGSAAPEYDQDGMTHVMTRHRLGWRASKARVVAIAQARRRGMRALASRYGVPLVDVDDLEERASEHGRRWERPDLDAIAPPPPPMSDLAATLRNLFGASAVAAVGIGMPPPPSWLTFGSIGSAGLGLRRAWTLPPSIEEGLIRSMAARGMSWPPPGVPADAVLTSAETSFVPPGRNRTTYTFDAPTGSRYSIAFDD